MQSEASSTPDSNPGRSERGSPIPEPLDPAVAAALDGEPTLVEQIHRIRRFSPPSPRYSVLGEVGEGAMGRVLRVSDEVLGRELAMKVITLDAPPDATTEERVDHERQVARFIEEASITGKLHHPGIVPVHEIALDDQGCLYFTMPLVEGNTLTEVFRFVRDGEKGWNLHQALEVVRQVCRAVAYAHSEHIVHRDLKPDNVMVGKYKEVFVLDWGLALLEELKKGRSVVGTPGYMAPEQSTNPGEVGPLSDIYSLGAILYELLGRTVPHERTMEETPGQLTIHALIQKPPRPLIELAPDVPEELVAICDKAMAARPADRYETAEDLADDIGAWLEGRVVQAYDTGFVARVKKWHARNLSLAVAWDAVAVATVAIVALVIFFQDKVIREVQAKNVETLQKSYAADLHSADLSLEMLHMSDARRHLRSCPPDLRRWEWRHLRLASDSSDLVLAGHDDISSLDVSPDGATVVTASDDGTVRFWDARSGENRSVLVAAPGSEVRVVRFHPKGRLIASGSKDRRVLLWDVATGTLERDLGQGDSPIADLAFSPDGRRLAVADHGDVVRVHDLEREADVGRLALSEELGWKSLLFESDSRHLIIGLASGGVVRWDSNGTEHQLAPAVGNGSVAALALTPDGENLFVAAGAHILELDLDTLASLRELSGHAGIVACLDVDEGGEMLLSGAHDATLRLWSLESGASRPLSGHVDEVTSARFLPGDGRFVSGSSDGTARIWSANSGPVLILDGHDEWATSVAFDRTGSRVVSGSRDGQLRIWSARDGTRIETVPTGEQVSCVAWTAEGCLVFGNSVFVEEIESEEETWLRVRKPGEATFEVLRGGATSPLSVAVHPKTGHILSRTAGGTLHLWPPGHPTPSLELGEGGELEGSSCVAFHPVDERFAVAFNDGRIEVRSSVDGEVLEDLRDVDRIVSLAYSPDGELLAAGTVHRTIVIWSTADGREWKRISGHENWITAVDFSPDGTRLVSGSEDGTVRIWRVSTGDPLLRLRGHTSGVTAVAFDPTGSQIASASKDGTVRLWRTPFASMLP